MVEYSTVGRMPRIIATLASILLALAPAQSWAQSASLLPNAVQQFFNASGIPIANGQVFFYIPSTTSQKTVWSDAGQTSPLTQPVQLNAGGYPQTGIGALTGIYGAGQYREVVLDSLGNTIWDQVTSAPLVSNAGQVGNGDGLAVGTILPFSGATPPTNYQFAFGQALVRADFPALFTALTLTQNVTCIQNNTTLTVQDSTYMRVGESVESTCLNAGTTVSSITNLTTIVLNQGAASSTSTTATFFPWGNGNGGTTFNVPDLRSYVLAGTPNMGGTNNGLVSQANCGSSPTQIAALGGNCGTQSSALVQANLPNLVPSFTGTPATLTGTFTGTNTPSFTGTVNHFGTFNLNNGPNANQGWTAGDAQATATTAGGSTVGVTGGGAGAHTVTANLLSVTIGDYTPAGTINGGVAAGSIAMNSYTPAGTISNLNGGAQTDISRIQPTVFVSYIIKVTADVATTLPTINADSVMSNFGPTAAVPSGFPMPNCGVNQALQYSTVTHLLTCFNVPAGNVAAVNTWTADNYFASGRPWCDVRAKGAKGDSATDDAAAFNACIAEQTTVSPASGLYIYVPPGIYCIKSATTAITQSVRIVGSSTNSAIISACGVDQTIFTFSNAAYGSIENITFFGKGTNFDSGSFGATVPVITLSGTGGMKLDNVAIHGGSIPLNIIGGSDMICRATIATDGYGTADAYIQGHDGARFHKCSTDHQWPVQGPTNANFKGAWTGTTAYNVGDVVTDGGYNIQARVAGTSGGSLPTLKNYLIDIPDGTVTWRLVNNVNLSGLVLDSGTSEFQCVGCDFSGAFVHAVFLTDSLVTGGPVLNHFTHTVFSQSQGSAILVSAGSDLTLADNEILGCVQNLCDAVRFSGSFSDRARIYGNIIASNLRYGVNIGIGTDIIITNNVFRSNTTAALNVAAGISHWTFANNSCAAGNGACWLVASGASVDYVAFGNTGETANLFTDPNLAANAAGGTTSTIRAQGVQYTRQLVQSSGATFGPQFVALNTTAGTLGMVLWQDQTGAGYVGNADGNTSLVAGSTTAVKWTVGTSGGLFSAGLTDLGAGTVNGVSSTMSSTDTASAFIPTGSSVPANGMYLPSANTLGFAANSTFQFNAAGSVMNWNGANDTVWRVGAAASNTAGKGLTIQAGSALAGSGTDLAAGNLTLQSGAGTGTGATNIVMDVFGGGSTGTGGSPQRVAGAGTAAMTIFGATGFVAIGNATADTILKINNNAAAAPAIPAATNLVHMIGADSTATGFMADAFGANPNNLFRRANGTNASPTKLVSTNVFMSLNGRGYFAGGTPGYSGARGTFSCAAAEDWNDSTHNGSYCSISTTPTASATIAEIVRAQPSGGLSVGAANVATDGGAGVVVATGYQAGASAGTSATKTVRAAGGAADCTLIFTGGILTGGSC